ncbi:MAG: hypothetical protein WDM85_09815 [Caulobacteraceae bacterium]
MQLHVEGGKARLRTRKGLTGASGSRRSPRAGEGLADCLIDGEIVALDDNGAPTSPRCRPRSRPRTPGGWSTSCSTPCSSRARTCGRGRSRTARRGWRHFSSAR